MSSKRKPHNDLAGYVCERKSRHPRLPGHFVILDRQKGGDWIDADDRWILTHVKGDECGCHVSVGTLRSARELMKEMAAGGNAVDLGQYEDADAWEAEEQERQDEYFHGRAKAFRQYAGQAKRCAELALQHYDEDLDCSLASPDVADILERFIAEMDGESGYADAPAEEAGDAECPDIAGIVRRHLNQIASGQTEFQRRLEEVRLPAAPAAVMEQRMEQLMHFFSLPEDKQQQFGAMFARCGAKLARDGEEVSR